MMSCDGGDAWGIQLRFAKQKTKSRVVDLESQKKKKIKKCMFCFFKINATCFDILFLIAFWQFIYTTTAFLGSENANF